MLTAGRRHDITCVEALVNGYNSEYTIADTSYNAPAFIESIAEKGRGAGDTTPCQPLWFMHL